MRLWLPLALCASCGRIAFDPFGGTGGPPFGEPTPLIDLNTSAIENDPTLTSDLLEIYFASDRSGEGEIWRASRATPTSPWQPPALVTNLNSTSDEAAPKVSRDGLTILFHSNRGGSAVWISTRANRLDPWSAPIMLTELGPALSASADASLTHLVLHDFLGGGSNLYTTTRSSTVVPWEPRQPVLELEGPTDDLMPCLTSNGLVLYFASDRPGGSVRDLYRAERPSPTVAFGVPEPIVELNTSMSDTDPWISDDERVMVFARGDVANFGGMDLYEAHR